MLKLNCKNCDGRCCKFNAKNFNVILIPKEIRKFRKYSKVVKTNYGQLNVLRSKENGNCVFLMKKK